MCDQALAHDQVLNVQCVLIRAQHLLAAFYEPRSIGEVDEVTRNLLHALERCNGLLEPNAAGHFGLAPLFRAVIADVLGGRGFDALTNEDFGRIAMRNQEWMVGRYAGWDAAYAAFCVG